jgi:hypothetical protein
MKISSLALVAAGALALASPTFATTTALSGAINVDPTALIGTSSVVAPKSASWTGAPTTLNVTATATNIAAHSSITATATTQATWASANQGAVTFTNYGWNVLTTNLAPQPESAALWHVTDWSYTFTAGSNGAFTMNYNVVGVGQTFGLQGWGISWTGPGGSAPLGAPAPSPTTMGTFTRSLVAGQTYTVSLQNNANIDIASANGNSAVGSMSGQYNWTIVGASLPTPPPAVPEPATWAIMFAGLFGVGAALRHRRASLAAAA